MSPRNHPSRTNQVRAHWPWRLILSQAIRATRQERGTVLLMVIGVLALLAIIGVVYATIGRADRSVAVTAQKQQRITDQAEEIAAYIAKVIGDATLAQYVERTEGPPLVPPGSTANAWKFRTRGYTYPWTDDHFLSFEPANYANTNIGPCPQGLPPAPASATDNIAWYTKFSPTGENLDPWWGTAYANAAAVRTPDPRNHADPYLAVLEPESLAYLTPTRPPNPGGKLYDIRDWRHISNLSPSGNFVNLANLRRSQFGGFDASPGFRKGTTTCPAQMSYGLTLFDPMTGSMQLAGTATSSPQRLPGGGNANPANPAHWSNNQVFAFEPAIASGAAMPNQYEYVLNQWADADGDGFLDSRWFELTDLSGMFGNGTSAIKQLVPTRGRVRLFCAARVIDNSAKINVNVACDMVTGGPWPTIDFIGKNPDGSNRILTRDDAYPPGLTAADIAINRVLRLTDTNIALKQLGPGGNALGAPYLGYSGLPIPSTSASDSTSTSYNAYDNTQSTVIGNASYPALIDARRRGPTAIGGLGASLPAAYYTHAAERYQHYDIFASDPRSARAAAAYGSPTTGAGLNQSIRVLRSPFDLSDELELAAFFGVNDSDTLSRLESTLGGRATAINLSTFSPLRDNRPRSLEMSGRDEFDGSTMFVASTQAQQTLLSVYTDIRHLMTTVSGSRPMKDGGVAPDPASDITKPSTFNPASTDISAALKAISNYSRFDRAPRFDDLPRASTPFDQPAVEDYNNFKKAVQLIFKLYANALAPYTDLNEFPSAWLTTPTGADRDGLVYGGNAELALRMAAHMTANLVDAFDRDRTLDGTITPGKGRPASDDRAEQVAVALQLAKTPGTTLLPSGVPTNRAYMGGVTLDMNAAFPLPADPSRLPKTPGALPSSTQYPSQVGKMTIFGVEPQPFLTEFGTLALYTDAPRDAGGDDDAAPAGTGGGLPLPLVATSSYITIDMTPAFTNVDFICEVIAFQLNNPFEQDIILYDAAPPAGASSVVNQNKYYIEYCARYYGFKVQDKDSVEFNAAAPTVRLRAGRTQTFYVVNPGTLRAVGQRIKTINTVARTADTNAAWMTDDDYTTAAKTWIENQLQSTVGGSVVDAPIQLTQIDPHTFDRIENRDLEPDMDLWGERPPLPKVEDLNTPPHSIAERRVCHLWRTVISRSSQYPSTLPSPGGSTDEETIPRGSANDPTNDILADRMHDPSDATLAGGNGYLYGKRTGSSTNSGVTDAVGGDDTTGNAQENSGYSAILWSSIRRPTDTKQGVNGGTPGGTQDSLGRPIRGVLPPWCLEARCDNKWSTSGQRSLNKAFSGLDSQGVQADYTTARADRFTKLKLALGASSAANPEIGTSCAKKATVTGANPIGKTREVIPYAAFQREYSEVAVEFHSVGEDIFGGAENGDPSGPAIRRSRNPALFSRAGDFLLPLAIGPWFDPSRNGSDLQAASPIANIWTGAGTSLTADREASWMTLSEALALSCGYYSPEDPQDPLFEFGVYAAASGSNPAHPPRADRGHLVLDHYTPHLQLPTLKAQPLGSGVPFALSIIDQFRAASGISSTPKLVSPNQANVVGPEQQTRDVSFGGGSTTLDVPQTVSFLTRREGVINLNTATVGTYRSLPLVTPEDDALSWTQKPDSYFGPVNSIPPLFDTANPLGYDLAPTIKAYRDLSRETYRSYSGATAVPAVDFSIAQARLNKPQPPATLNFVRDSFRRETRGFKSLGEIASVNVINPDPASTVADLRVDSNSMFRFANPEGGIGAPTELPGTLGTPNRRAQRLSFQPSLLSSRFYNRNDNGLLDKSGPPPMNGNPSAPYYPIGGAELPRGYQDKLAIVNALTNTASVRSDVFTVYFVIHGYTPDDCDVEDSQPLVPSVAKRYVMVVDRTNVVAPGHKPRILMLKEVPMQ